MGEPSIGLEVEYHGPGTIACEWAWKNTEGVTVLGGDPDLPPTMLLVVTHMPNPEPRHAD